MNEKKRILCVGLCVLDFVHICDKFPEEDSDKRTLNVQWQRGGNAMNNCTVLKLLGANCEFLGVLSGSHAFQFLEEDCKIRHILTSNCPKVNQDPIFSSIILSQKTKSRTIVCTNRNFPILKYEDFKKIQLEQYEWMHFEARNPQETSLMIEDVVRHNANKLSQIKLSLELEKPRAEDLILAEQMDYVFLGKDFSIFLGWNELKEALYSLRKRLNNKMNYLICTWGSKGSAILDPQNQYTHIKSYPPDEILDTLGAGDTFCAATIYSLSLGKNVKDAVEFGNKIAGYKISFYGYDNIKNFRDFV